MGIRDALSSVPAKPVIAAVIGITILTAGWHSWNVYEICTRRANLSDTFHNWANSVLAESGVSFQLDAATDFDWDQVRISQSGTNLGPVRSCPLGWHWSNEERTKLAQDGDLTLIGFFSKGLLLAIVDFDKNWALFDIGDEPISRQQAVFESVSDANILKLSNP